VTLAGTHHILVDCGVHNTGHVKADGEDLLQKAFENIQQATGRKLAIVIATMPTRTTFRAMALRRSIQGIRYRRSLDAVDRGSNDATARQWRGKRGACGPAPERLAAAGDAVAAAPWTMHRQSCAMQALHSGSEGYGALLKAGDTVDAPAGLTGFSARIWARRKTRASSPR